MDGLEGKSFRRQWVRGKLFRIGQIRSWSGMQATRIEHSMGIEGLFHGCIEPCYP